MKLLKFFLFTSVFFCACSVFAQKPIVVTVWPEVNPSDSENRVSSLLWEYYKSELATHSRLKLSPQETVDSFRKTIPATERKVTPELVTKICKGTGADILCAVYLSRNATENKYNMSVRIYTADGKLKKELKQNFKAVRESDFVSVIAARDTAVAIRGDNPADVINKAREKTLLLELQREDGVKRKNANAQK